MNSVRNICGSDLVRGLIWPRRLLGVFVVMDVCADKVLNPGFGSAHCKLHIRCKSRKSIRVFGYTYNYKSSLVVGADP